MVSTLCLSPYLITNRVALDEWCEKNKWHTNVFVSEGTSSFQKVTFSVAKEEEWQLYTNEIMHYLEKLPKVIQQITSSFLPPTLINTILAYMGFFQGVHHGNGTYCLTLKGERKEFVVREKGRSRFFPEDSIEGTFLNGIDLSNFVLQLMKESFEKLLERYKGYDKHFSWWKEFLAEGKFQDNNLQKTIHRLKMILQCYFADESCFVLDSDYGKHHLLRWSSTDLKKEHYQQLYFFYLAACQGCCGLLITQ